MVTELQLTLTTLCLLISTVNALSSELIMLQLLDEYDNKVHPNQDTDYPTRVNVSLYIGNIHSINEATSEYSLDGMLTQEWQDPRLNYDSLIAVQYISVSQQIHKSIWKPDTIFTNQRKLSIHNSELRIHRDGKIRYQYRFLLTVSQVIETSGSQLFILPIQTAYTVETKVELRWNETNPVVMNKDIQLSQFTIKHVGSQNYIPHQNNEGLSGIAVYLFLESATGFPLLLPSIFIITASWVPFWLDSHAILAKSGISVVTLVSVALMATMNITTTSKWSTTVSIWMTGCLVFVFLALVETILVLVVSRRVTEPPTESGVTATAETPEAVDGNADMKIEVVPPSKAEEKTKWPKGLPVLRQKHAAKIDLISRALFPSFLAVFTVLFFAIFL